MDKTNFKNVLALLVIICFVTCKKDTNTKNVNADTGLYKWSGYSLPDIGWDTKTISSLVADTNGRIYIGGNFSSYGFYNHILYFDSNKVESGLYLRARTGEIWNQKLAINSSNQLFCLDIDTAPTHKITVVNFPYFNPVCNTQKWEYYSGNFYASCNDNLGNVYYGTNFYDSVSNANYQAIKFFGNKNYQLIKNKNNGTEIFDMQTSVNGLLYALFRSTSTNKNYTLAKWDGNSWTDINFIPNAEIISNILYDGIKYLYITGYYPNTFKPFVARYDGVIWEIIPNWQSSFPTLVQPYFTQQNGYKITWCTDKKGNIYNLVNDPQYNTTKIYASRVIKWDGNTWTLTDCEITHDLYYSSTFTAICCDNKGNIYVGVDGGNTNTQCALYKYAKK